MGPVKLDQRKAVDLGHDQVLKDDGRLEANGGRDGLDGVCHMKKLKVGLPLEHQLHGFANDFLVVHKKDPDGVGHLEGNRSGMAHFDTVLESCL